jgi:NADH:ubiquinone oxidoreductase subunit 2 (subunit N)
VCCLNKIGPFLILSSVYEFVWVYLVVLGLVGSVVRRVVGINQTQVRSIIGYSSVNHIRWLVCVMCFNVNASFLYLGFYIFLTGVLFFGLHVNNVNSHIILKTKFFSVFTLLRLVICLLSYVGLPPFAGFTVKLVSFSVVENLYILIVLSFSSLVAM